MVFTPLRVVTQESEFPHRISGRQVAMLTRCDLVDSDLTVENGGQDELGAVGDVIRSEEHTSELQSLMRISYAVFCLKKKKTNKNRHKNLTPKVHNEHD